MIPVFNTKIKLAILALISILIGFFLTFSILKSIETIRAFNAKSVAVATDNIVPGKVNKETNSKYFYINKNSSELPKISALAYLVGDLDTGEVIISKNQEEKFPVASTTKLMTALVAKSINNDPNNTIKINKTTLATEGKNGELKLGEQIKISDLLYPLLLESSNDAAEALASYFERADFISKMNQQAEKLKMEKTSYEDPSGLSSNNQSTVSDMFKLTGYLSQQQPELLQITTKRSYSNKKHNWSNISQFLGENGYLGGKSGYTDKAKQTMISVFSLPLGESVSRPIAITLLQSNDRKKDIDTILQYLKNNIYYGGEKDANTNWVKEKVGVPDIKDPNFITLSFAGDMMLDRGVRNSVIKNFGNDYSALFENLNIFKKSDIAFANLEGTASDQGKDLGNLYSFRMDPSSIPAMKGAGLSIVSVANNHVGDWGRDAYIDTLLRLKENEILYTGGGMDEKEAETPTIIEKYGIKIGFLGFSDVGPNWMKAENNNAGLLLANNPRFEEIIQNASKQVDYLVVSFHFGEEYKEIHNKRQEFLAHQAVDNGAKIVIGHHPHVVEDTEVYKKSFIAYSLGNFIFDQSWSKPTMKGLLVEIKLNRDGSMSIKKNPTQLNSVFQLEKIIEGKEEKLKF